MNINAALQPLTLGNSAAIDGGDSFIAPQKTDNISAKNHVPPSESLISGDKEQLLTDRKIYMQHVEKLKKNYPHIIETASKYLRDTIKEKYGLDVNPDHTYFNRFDHAESSSQTFTGWAHSGGATESQTLTERLLSNFGAEDRLNADTLSVNSGIYTQGYAARGFDTRNEVKLLPRSFMDIVVNSNFSAKYLAKLKQFWNKSPESFRTVNKGLFIAMAKHEHNSGTLSTQGLKLLLDAIGGTTLNADKISLTDLKNEFSQRTNTSITTFDIYGYIASDMFLVHGNDGKVVLYKPDCDQSFFEFDTMRQLKNWVKEQAKNERKRQQLANHFSFYQRQDGMSYTGVDKALLALGQGKWGSKYINYEPQPIKDDVFSWLTRQVKARTLSDANTLTTTNGEVFKQQLLMNLRPAADLAGLSTLIFPGPGSMALLGIGITQIGLGSDQAINDDSSSQRSNGLDEIVNGGVNTLFGAIGVKANLAGGKSKPSAVQDANEPQPGPSNGRPAAKVSNKTWIHRLLDNTVVHERGLAAIKANNPGNGAAIEQAMLQMKEALIKASEALDTLKGRKIAAAYLGYDDASQLTETDIANIRKNITAMQETTEWLIKTDMSVKTVSIYDKKRSNVGAYYNPQKNIIAFPDLFFTKDAESQLHTLLHETVHASLKVNGEVVPDYYYLRSSPIPAPEGVYQHPILDKRNEQLRISHGNTSLFYFIGQDGHMLENNFVKGMQADTLVHAGIKFIENAEARRALLMRNPDTQALLIMDLAGKITGTTRNNGTMIGIDPEPAKT